MTARTVRANFSGIECPLHVSLRPVDGAEIALLFIHGNPGTHGDFDALLAQMPASVTTACIDLPGFGFTPALPPQSAGTLEEMARGIYDAVTTLQLPPRLVVVGHSHGAALALAMGWVAPQRVDRLVLLGSLGARAHAAYRQLAFPGVASAAGLLSRWGTTPAGARAVRGIVEGVLKNAFAPAAVPPDYRARVVREMARNPQSLRSIAALATGGPCEQLKNNCTRVPAPTLFLHGAADGLVPQALARHLHEARLTAELPSTFISLPQVGHMLHLSHPEPIATAMADFLLRPAQQTPSRPA